MAWFRKGPHSAKQYVEVACALRAPTSAIHHLRPPRINPVEDELRPVDLARSIAVSTDASRSIAFLGNQLGFGPCRQSSDLVKRKSGWIPTFTPRSESPSLCAKSTPQSQNQTTAPDDAVSALRDEFTRDFRANGATIADEFRQQLVYPTGTLGAAMRALNPSPARVSWNAPDSEKALSLRSGFQGSLELWCKSFARQLKAFARNLCEIGQPIDAVERGLEDVCVQIADTESRNWLACFCGDGHLAPTGWRAPGWLVDWPAEVKSDPTRSAALHGRLGNNQTEEILKAVRNAIREELVLAKVQALNGARILIAREENRSQARYKGKGTGETTEPRNNHRSKFHDRIVDLMKKHPTKSYREILGMIDGEEGIEIPSRFKKHEHCSRGMVMVRAYDCKACRRTVEVFMSRMRRPLGLPQAHKSRRPRRP